MFIKLDLGRGKMFYTRSYKKFITSLAEQNWTRRLVTHRSSPMDIDLVTSNLAFVHVNHCSTGAFLFTYITIFNEPVCLVKLLMFIRFQQINQKINASKKKLFKRFQHTPG